MTGPSWQSPQSRLRNEGTTGALWTSLNTTLPVDENRAVQHRVQRRRVAHAEGLKGCAMYYGL